MTEFKKYRNKQTGKIIEAEPEELALCGSEPKRWHLYWNVGDDLIPNDDFVKKFEELPKEDHE